MALAQAVLLSLVAGALSLGDPGAAILDPTSNAAATAGNGYAQQAAAPAQGFSSVNGGLAANTAAAAGAVAAPPQTFNPMAMAQQPLVDPNTHAISNSFNALINGDQQGMANAAKGALQEAPSAAGRLVDGFVKGWFQHVVLQAGEEDCIRKNLRTMTKDSASLISELAKVIMDAVAKNVQDPVAMMAGGAQVIELVTTATAFTKQCIKSDAVGVMTATMNHLGNPAYVKGRLLANGLEIVQQMSDTIVKAQQDRWIEVGVDMGKVLRKALLSDDHDVVQLVLPQGCLRGPQECAAQVGPMCVEGVVKGIFVQGTRVKITSKVDTTINIDIDLHRCVAKEAAYVMAAANSVYLAISQLATTISKLHLKEAGVQTGVAQGSNIPPVDTSEWMAGLTGLMTNVPIAMDRCGMTPAQIADLKKATQDMANLQAAFTIPGPADKAAATAEASTRLASATRYWSVGQYSNFGIMAGGMMRDLLLTMFPSRSASPPAPRLYENWERAHLDDANAPAGTFALYVCGFAAVALFALAALRVKSQVQTEHPALLEENMEQASDVEAVE